MPRRRRSFAIAPKQQKPSHRLLSDIMARGGSRRRSGGGRIRPIDRSTDDTTAPIAAGANLRASDAAAIELTELKSMKDSCRSDYRNRNNRYMKYLSREYPQVYQDGTIGLSDAEIATANKYYFNKTRDLVYSGFRVDIFKAFLSSTKVKKIDEDGNEILKSPEDLRKYGDAVMWGAQIVGQRLPTEYYEEMDRFKASYKKEYAGAKKDGRVEENEAEPITAKLFRLMCQIGVCMYKIFTSY